MGNQIDEAVGNVKEKVGDMTDNEKLEREGREEADRAKMERETEGAVDKTVGKAQETWGDITGDEAAQAKGKARQVEGDVKRAG